MTHACYISRLWFFHSSPNWMYIACCVGEKCRGSSSPLHVYRTTPAEARNAAIPSMWCVDASTHCPLGLFHRCHESSWSQLALEKQPYLNIWHMCCRAVGLHMVQKRASCASCGMILAQRRGRLQRVSSPEVLKMSCGRQSRFTKMMSCCESSHKYVYCRSLYRKSVVVVYLAVYALRDWLVWYV